MTGLGFHEIDLHYKQDIDNSNNNWWVKLGFQFGLKSIWLEGYDDRLRIS